MMGCWGGRLCRESTTLVGSWWTGNSGGGGGDCGGGSGWLAGNACTVRTGEVQWSRCCGSGGSRPPARRHYLRHLRKLRTCGT